MKLFKISTQDILANLCFLSVYTCSLALMSLNMSVLTAGDLALDANTML